MTLRNEIIHEIMKLVRPDPVEMKPKPTIADLEKILSGDNQQEIDLRPDGSIYTRPPSVTTVGIVADAVLKVVKDRYESGDCDQKEQVHDRP